MHQLHFLLTVQAARHDLKESDLRIYSVVGLLNLLRVPKVCTLDMEQLAQIRANQSRQTQILRHRFLHELNSYFIDFNTEMSRWKHNKSEICRKIQAPIYH